MHFCYWIPVAVAVDVAVAGEPAAPAAQEAVPALAAVLQKNVVLLLKLHLVVIRRKLLLNELQVALLVL